MIFYFKEYHSRDDGELEFDGIVAVQGDELGYKFNRKAREEFWRRIDENAKIRGVQLLRYYIQNNYDYIVRSNLQRTTEEDLDTFLETEFN